MRDTFTPPLPRRNQGGYGNINPFAIGFPFRGTLRTRLTLIRLTLIRNPWSIGGQVSRLPYRYLCLHLLFSPLQQNSRLTFYAEENAPLPLYTDV